MTSKFTNNIAKHTVEMMEDKIRPEPLLNAVLVYVHNVCYLTVERTLINWEEMKT